MRGETGVMNYGFIGIFENGRVHDIKGLDIERYRYINAYKTWQRCGFTKKSLEWNNIMQRNPELEQITLKQFYTREDG